MIARDVDVGDHKGIDERGEGGSHIGDHQPATENGGAAATNADKAQGLVAGRRIDAASQDWDGNGQQEKARGKKDEGQRDNTCVDQDDKGWLAEDFTALAVFTEIVQEGEVDEMKKGEGEGAKHEPDKGDAQAGLAIVARGVFGSDHGGFLSIIGAFCENFLYIKRFVMGKKALF